MDQPGTHEEEIHTLDPVASSKGAPIETVMIDDIAALLQRATVLEGREHALNAELAALRADLGDLRQHLHQARMVEGLVGDASADDDPGATVDEATPTMRDAPAGGSDMPPLLPSSPMNEAEVSSFSGPEKPDLTRSSSPGSSNIDDLIHEAVSSRGRDRESPGQPLEPPTDVAAFASLGVPARAPAAEDGETPPPKEDTTPSGSGVEDFFIGQSSSRRGRG